MNGQCVDSTPADWKLMKFRAHVLHSLLIGFVQRYAQQNMELVVSGNPIGVWYIDRGLIHIY